MTPEARRGIEHEVQRIVMLFYRYLDSCQYQKLAEQFTEDGVWVRRGNPLKGHAEIIEEMTDRRQKNFRTRHIVTNMIVDPIDEKSAEAYYIVTGYGKDVKSMSDRAELESPLSIATHKDLAVLTPKGWRLKHFEGPLDFVRTNVPGHFKV